MKSNCTNYLVAACLLVRVLIGSVSAQAQIDPQLADSLQSKLNDLWFTKGVKGISAAVYIPGQGMWKGVAGYSYASIPIDTNMLFSIGSVTKTFVATEIMKLEEEGLLDIEDSIKDYLPPHPYIDSTIKLRHLLNHTSGMGEYLGTPWQNAMFANLTRRWGIQETFDTFSTPKAFTHGASWSYTNTNYLLLGLIIESLRHDSLHHVLRQHYLDPLGLDEIYMHILEPFSNPMPHNWANANMTPGSGMDVSSYAHDAMWTSIEPSGGMFSTAGDLAMWGYKLYSGQVITTASLAKMENFVNLSGYNNGYGLGCMRFRFNNRNYYGHGGNFFGYAASMFFNPADSVTLTMLVNEDCLSPTIAAELFNTLIKTIKLNTPGMRADDLFAIYPNPASGELTVGVGALPAAGGVLSIYSVSGNVVHTENIRGNSQVNFSVTDLPAGMYFCELLSEKGKKVQKLVVAH